MITASSLNRNPGGSSNPHHHQHHHSLMVKGNGSPGSHSAHLLENGRSVQVDPSQKFLIPTAPVPSSRVTHNGHPASIMNDPAGGKSRRGGGGRSIINGTPAPSGTTTSPPGSSPPSSTKHNYGIMNGFQQHPQVHSSGTRRSNGYPPPHPTPQGRQSSNSHQPHPHSHNHGSILTSYQQHSRSSSSTAPASSGSPNKARSPGSSGSYSPQLPPGAQVQPGLPPLPGQVDFNSRLYPPGFPHLPHPHSSHAHAASIYAAAAAAASHPYHHHLYPPLFGGVPPYPPHSATTYLDNFHSNFLAQQQAHLQRSTASSRDEPLITNGSSSGSSNGRGSIDYGPNLSPKTRQMSSPEEGRYGPPQNGRHPNHYGYPPPGSDPHHRHHQVTGQGQMYRFPPPIPGLAKGGPLGFALAPIDVPPISKETWVKQTGTCHQRSNSSWHGGQSEVFPEARNRVNEARNPTSQNQVSTTKGKNLSQFPKEEVHRGNSKSKQFHPINSPDGLDHGLRSPKKSRGSSTNNSQIFTFPEVRVQHQGHHHPSVPHQYMSPQEHHPGFYFKMNGNGLKGQGQSSEGIPNLSFSLPPPISPNEQKSSPSSSSFPYFNFSPPPPGHHEGQRSERNHEPSSPNSSKTQILPYPTDPIRNQDHGTGTSKNISAVHTTPSTLSNGSISSTSITISKVMPLTSTHTEGQLKSSESIGNPGTKVLPVEQMPVLQAFRAGSLIQLASGSIRAVEDLKVEDFLAAAMSDKLRIIHCTVLSIQVTEEVEEDTEMESGKGLCKVTLAMGSLKHQVVVDAPPEQPFFILGRGWSSWSPGTTQKLLQLPCTRLNVGDVCITVSKESCKGNGNIITGNGTRRTTTLSPPKSPMVRSRKGSTSALPSSSGVASRAPGKSPLKPSTSLNPSIPMTKSSSNSPGTIPSSPKRSQVTKAQLIGNGSPQSEPESMGPPPSPLVPKSLAGLLGRGGGGGVKDENSNRPRSPPKRRWSAPTELGEPEGDEQGKNVNVVKVQGQDDLIPSPNKLMKV